MALYAVAITKRTLHAGFQENFDNTYFYDGPALQLGDENFRRLVDRIVAAEKLVHANRVEFMTGRVWSAGGTVVENVTQGLYDLDGFGSMLTNHLMATEQAVLVEWECSRPNILGRKVYLRKFIRSQALPPPATADMALGRALLDQATRDAYATYADSVERPSDATMPEFTLCSPQLRKPRVVGNGVADAVVRTREFRRN